MSWRWLKLSYTELQLFRNWVCDHWYKPTNARAWKRMQQTDCQKKKKKEQLFIYHLFIFVNTTKPQIDQCSVLYSPQGWDMISHRKMTSFTLLDKHYCSLFTWWIHKPLSAFKALLLFKTATWGLRSDRTVIAQIMPVGGTKHTHNRDLMLVHANT